MDTWCGFRAPRDCGREGCLLVLSEGHPCASEQTKDVRQRLRLRDRSRACLQTALALKDLAFLLLDLLVDGRHVLEQGLVCLLGFVQLGL